MTPQPGTSKTSHVLLLLSLLVIGVYTATKAGRLRSLPGGPRAASKPRKELPADDFEFDEEYLAIVQALTAPDFDHEDSEKMAPDFASHRHDAQESAGV